MKPERKKTYIMRNQLEAWQYELLAGIPELFEKLASHNPRHEYAYNLCADHVRASFTNILGMLFHTVQVEEAEHEVQ